MKKSPLGGKKITKKQALKGLGNPKDWEKFANEVYKEFKKKPRK